MIKMRPNRIRKIRESLEFSRSEFARTLWAARTTVDQWESGDFAPVGMHHRLLVLLEQGLKNPSFRSALRDSRTSDPMFLLYRLLEPLYRDNSSERLQKKVRNIREPANMSKATAIEVRRIRKALGFSQEDFARFLWVTFSTLNRWEADRAVPFGMHLHLLRLLKKNMSDPVFKTALLDPRAVDPLFLLYRLLEPLYGSEPSQGKADRQPSGRAIGSGFLDR